MVPREECRIQEFLVPFNILEENALLWTHSYRQKEISIF